MQHRLDLGKGMLQGQSPEWKIKEPLLIYARYKLHQHIHLPTSSQPLICFHIRDNSRGFSVRKHRVNISKILTQTYTFQFLKPQGHILLYSYSHYRQKSLCHIFQLQLACLINTCIQLWDKQLQVSLRKAGSAALRPIPPLPKQRWLKHKSSKAKSFLFSNQVFLTAGSQSLLLWFATSRGSRICIPFTFANRTQSLLGYKTANICGKVMLLQQTALTSWKSVDISQTRHELGLCISHLCLSERKKSRSSGVWVSAWTIQFIKHVFPRLISPRRPIKTEGGGDA